MNHLFYKFSDQNQNRPLSEEKITYTMIREYFTFIGTFSSFPQGVKLLQDFKVVHFFLNFEHLDFEYFD